MPNYNKTLLMGHLTRDPELRYVASGAPVCSFGLAVNHKYKSGEEWKTDVCFIEITAWAKQAENCAEYLKKGSAVFVEGRLNFQQWETDGQKRSKHEVVAQSVQFLDRKQKEEDSIRF